MKIENKIEKYLNENDGRFLAIDRPGTIPTNIDYIFDKKVEIELKNIIKKNSYNIKDALEKEKEFAYWLNKQDMKKFDNKTANQIWKMYEDSDINIGDLFNKR